VTTDQQLYTATQQYFIYPRCQNRAVQLCSQLCTPATLPLRRIIIRQSNSTVRCSHFTLGNPKKSFSTLLFTYLRFNIYVTSWNKTKSNCCTAPLAVYLPLFSASYCLHSPSTASGAHYRRSACINMDMLRLVAATCCDMGWISAQRSVTD